MISTFKLIPHGRVWGFLFILFIALLSPSALFAKTHGISNFNALKYPDNFTHFDYTNPDAPKGGELIIGAMGTFDSLNPFIVKGTAPAGINFIYARLLETSQDTPQDQSYAFVAESMDLADDHSSITFYLNKKAKFSDNTPITADDVIWSFETLRDHGLPMYSTYYKNVSKVEKLDSHTVKFNFNTTKNTELPNIIGQLAILPRHFYKTVKFDTTSLTPPPTSGPYTIATVDVGRSITYKRNPDWWGKDIPSQKGSHNFDHFRIDYFRDDTALFEAFKSGKVDLRIENVAKNWATSYDFPAAKNGWVIRQEIPNKVPNATYGLFFNTRRPIFADCLVREALTQCLNFKWLNDKFFFNLYQRNLSYYPNSDLAATGKPGEQEEKILAPFKGDLPPEVSTQPFTLPEPANEAAFRQNLDKAQDLLNQAGWAIDKTIMKNKKTGEPLEFEILLADRGFEKIILTFKEALQRIGITLHVRLVDVTSYTYRVEHLDYDMIIGIFPQSPSIGNEQRDFFGSERADSAGTYNYAGIKNKVVDALIEQLIRAPSYIEMCTYAKAIDRVLLWNYYMIPAWHRSATFVAYWDKIGMPTIKPDYALINYSAWWADEKKAKALEESMKKQSHSWIKKLWHMFFPS